MGRLSQFQQDVFRNLVIPVGCKSYAAVQNTEVDTYVYLVVAFPFQERSSRTVYLVRGASVAVSNRSSFRERTVRSYRLVTYRTVTCILFTNCLKSFITMIF